MAPPSPPPGARGVEDVAAGMRAGEDNGDTAMLGRAARHQMDEKTAIQTRGGGGSTPS